MALPKGALMQKKWSLNAKIYSILAILTTTSILIAYLGLSRMQQINAHLTRISETVAVRAMLSITIGSQIRFFTVHLKDHLLAKDTQRMNELVNRIKDEKTEILKNIDTFTKMADPEAIPVLESLRNLFGRWETTTEEIRNLSYQNKKEEALRLSLEKGEPQRVEVVRVIDQLIKRNSKLMADSTAAAYVAYEQAKNLMTAVSVIGIFSTLLLAFLILRALTTVIDKLISQLRDNSTQVSAAARQIASSSEELSVAATEQAASLEETASSIEEMNSMVQRNAENASSTSNLASNTSESANKGKKVMEEMLTAIDDINKSNANIMDSITESNQKISEIIQVISEIGNKTKVINDIVFQTKLLSFNASVEAARAGEHGKGFAVVAEEVGSLAAMSGTAANEIAAMLEESIAKVENIVNESRQKVEHLIRDGKTKVEFGNQKAKECNVVLDEIVTKIKDVNLMSTEISSASNEQAKGVQEISKAMEQLDQVTQTNASTSEEAASAAEQLSAQSESLQNIVDVLVETIKGSTDNNYAVNLAVNTKKGVKIDSLKSQKFENKIINTYHQKSSNSYHNGVPSEHDKRFDEL